MVRVKDDSAFAVDDAAEAVPAKRRSVLKAVKLDALPLGVSQVDFDAALAAGREKGHLTQDELIDALHNVELTPEVLGTLLARINAEGVALVDDDVEELTQEIGGGDPAPPPAPATTNGQKGTRRKANGKRPTAPATESSGSAEDPVHTYLKEIGRVPLLNAAL